MSFLYKNEEFDNSSKSKNQFDESLNENISNNNTFISKSHLKLQTKNKTFIEILCDTIDKMSNDDLKYNKSYIEKKKETKSLENKLLQKNNNSKLKSNSHKLINENKININNNYDNKENKLNLTSFELSKNNTSTEKKSKKNNKSDLYKSNFNNSESNKSKDLKLDFRKSENNSNKVLYQNDVESNLKNTESNKSNDLKIYFNNSENNKSSKNNENNLNTRALNSEKNSEKNLYENSSKNKSKNKKKESKEQYPKKQINMTNFFTAKEIEELEGKRELINESNYKDLIMQKKKEKDLFFEYCEDINKLNEFFLSIQIPNDYLKIMMELKNLYIYNKIKLFDKKKQNFEYDYIKVLNKIVKNYRKKGINKLDREIHEEIDFTFNSFFHNNNGKIINLNNFKIVEDVINGKIKLEEINKIKVDDLLEIYKLKKCESLEIIYIEKEWKFIIDFFKLKIIKLIK